MEKINRGKSRASSVYQKLSLQMNPIISGYFLTIQFSNNPKIRTSLHQNDPFFYKNLKKLYNFFFRIILNIHYEDKLPQRRRRQQKGAYNRQWSNPLEALRYI